MKKLLVQYCLKSLITFLLILACCIPIVVVAHKIVQEQVMEQNRLQLQKGVNEVSENINKMYLMTSILKEDTNFISLSKINGKLPLENVISMLEARNQLRTLSGIYTFPKMSFVLFKNNDIFISNTQCSSDFRQYYGKFLEISNEEAAVSIDVIRQKMFDKKTLYSYYVAQELRYVYNSMSDVKIENVFMCFVRTNNDVGIDNSLTAGFIVSSDDLLNLLMSDECINDGFVRIYDTYTKDVVWQSGEDVGALDSANDQDNIIWNEHEYWLLSYENSSNHLRVVIGYPQSAIDHQVAELDAIMWTYIVIGLLLIVGLTLFLSYRHYSSIKPVFINLTEGKVSLKKGQNEYDFINQSLSNLVKDKNEYKTQLELTENQIHAIMIENLFVRGAYTEEELKEFEKRFPTPIEFFCVAILRMNLKEQDNYNVVLLSVLEYLKENCGYYFLNVHSGLNDELFLFELNPEDESNVNQIKLIFENMIAALAKDVDGDYNVGISAIGQGSANVHVCYNQAQQVLQAYYMEQMSSVNAYSILINNASENIIDLELLNKLYNFILCEDRDGITQLITIITKKCHQKPQQFEMQKQQLFYSIWQVIYSAFLNLSSDSQEIKNISAYSDNFTVETMMEALLYASLQVCNIVDENKKSRNTKLKEKILSYISQEFCKPDLTASSLCLAVGISDKYMFQFMKEQTGMTFINYVEQLRIEKAKEYLVNTNYSNEKIAEMTGFSALNTFYRVFNKRTGVSPSVYRKNFREQS